MSLEPTSQEMLNPHIGKFVSSSENSLGVGKVVDSNADFAVIEYFDSPIEEEETRYKVDEAIASISPVCLERQTRVYFLDRPSGIWRMGRVQGHIDHDHDGGGKVFISLPNTEQKEVPAIETYTRWSKSLKDPWTHLQAKLTESPHFHSSRHQLVAHFIKQRASCMGMTGLISSPIEIEPHQVEAVRKVLTDPIKRYLLADEVGLGKTIEAGVILRQHILDYPDSHSILVVTPESLLKQWRDELRSRCQIGADFGHQIELVSQDEIEHWHERPIDFMVIDEAHQFTRGSQFDRIKRLSSPEQCQSLLLLSATPVLGNESDFLRLLHLLDPSVYKLDELAGFRSRVQHRQTLADIFATFTPDTAPFFLESLANRLGALFPYDQQLQSMLKSLRPLLNEQTESFDSIELESQVKKLRIHISETYRLHRRILRNRRDETTSAIVTGRKNYLGLPWKNPTQSKIEEIIERWRERAIDSAWGEDPGSSITDDLAAIFAILIEAAWCDWNALISLAEIRLRTANCRALPAFGPIVSLEKATLMTETALFEGEEEILKEIVKMADSIARNHDEYLKILTEAVRALRGQEFYVVCFATSPALADDLFRAMRAGGLGGIARHALTNFDWSESWDNGTANILICDYRAEEGLNLHGKKSCMLHLDLPFSPNRLEQRIGRLDRFGTGSAVTSFAIRRSSSPYWEKWEESLDSAWKLFDRSIASLQYVVEDEMKIILREIFESGESAISDASERLKGSNGRIESEWRDIRNQDDLDSIQIDQSENTGNYWVDKIQTYDESSLEFESAYENWMVDLLQFRRQEEDGVRNGPIRYQYRDTDHGHQTLLPLGDLSRFFTEAIEDLDYGNGYHKAITPPLAFKRTQAKRRSIDIARIGNRVVEATRNHLNLDDRGTCFALWRQTQAAAQNADQSATATPYFRFDYIVEAAIPDSSGSSLRRKADGIFQPASETVWLSQYLLPPEDHLLPILELSYSSEDINLHPELWKTALSEADIIDWGDLCEHARKVSQTTTATRVSLDDKTSTAVRLHTTMVSSSKQQIRSRIDATSDHDKMAKNRLNQDLSRISEEAAIISNGITNPSIRLDACGVIFLSATPFSKALIDA